MAKEYKKEVMETVKSIKASIQKIEKLFNENNQRNIELDTNLLEKTRNEAANIQVRNQQLKYIIRLANIKRNGREVQHG
jgi:hypothetical protein